MQRLPAAPTLPAGTAAGSRLPDITFRPLDLKYHTVPAEHLARTTASTSSSGPLGSAEPRRDQLDHVQPLDIVVGASAAPSSSGPAHARIILYGHWRTVDLTSIASICPRFDS